MQDPNILLKSVNRSKIPCAFLRALISSLGLLIFLLTGCKQAESPTSPKRIIIPKMSSYISVDARLNESVWDRAANR